MNTYSICGIYLTAVERKNLEVEKNILLDSFRDSQICVVFLLRKKDREFLSVI